MSKLYYTNPLKFSSGAVLWEAQIVAQHLRKPQILAEKKQEIVEFLGLSKLVCPLYVLLEAPS